MSHPAAPHAASASVHDDAAVNASGHDDTGHHDLYPPKCKRSRTLWHDLLKLKKSANKANDSKSLQLPPESAYMRACTHHFAERLGMKSESLLQGVQKSVRVHAEPEEQKGTAQSAPAAQGTASTSGKRKASGEDDPVPGALGSDQSRAQSTSEGPPAKKPSKKPFVTRLASCAKSADAEGAKQVFRELVAADVPCTPDLCGTLLHIFCDSHSREGGSSDGASGSDMLQEAIAVFDAAKASGCVPDEAAWSGLVKLRCLRGEASDALAHIDEMLINGVTPRLRTFSPILSSASSAGNHALAQDVVQRVTGAGLALGVAEHLDLVRMAAGDGAGGEGRPRGEMVEALRRMAEETPLLSQVHVDALRASFAGGDQPAGGSGGGGDRRCGWRMVDATTDDEGICSVTGSQLSPLLLQDNQRADLTAAVPRLIGPKNKVNEFAKFTSWVARQIDAHGPYTYVLDGANIGFHGHSKWEASYRKAAAAVRAGGEQKSAHRDQAATADSGAEGSGKGGGGKGAGGKGAGGKGGGGKGGGSGAFQYGQIESVLESLRSASPDARTLVVLHVSHTDTRNMDPADADLLQRWRAAGQLFTSPSGMNDDWYWLYAAFASGGACRVVSNDEMRDHHFGMIQPRAFLRWKERHIVHFEIPHDLSSGDLPTLVHPLPYSHAMQESAGGAWHLPREGEARDGWVCLLPPANEPALAASQDET